MMKGIEQMVFIVIAPKQKELMGTFGELAFIIIIKVMNIIQFIRWYLVEHHNFYNKALP